MTWKLNLGINVPKSADLSHCRRRVHILNLLLRLYAAFPLHSAISVRKSGISTHW